MTKKFFAIIAMTFIIISATFIFNNRTVVAQPGPPCSTTVKSAWLSFGGNNNDTVTAYADIRCGDGVQGGCPAAHIEFEMWAWNGNTWVCTYVNRKDSPWRWCGDIFGDFQLISLTPGIRYHFTYRGWVDGSYENLFNYYISN